MSNPFRKMRGLTDRVLAANLMSHKMNIEGFRKFIVAQSAQNRTMWVVTVLGFVVDAAITLYILLLLK